MKFLLYTCTLLYVVLVLTSSSTSWALVPMLANPPPSAINNNNKAVPSTRRSLLEHFSLAVVQVHVATACLPFAAVAVSQPEPGDVVITLPQPGAKLGLELMDVKIGGSPSSARSVAAIKRVAASASSSNQRLQAGMILPDFESVAQVQQRLQTGPYPVTLTFRNLAAAGDAFADDGTPLVTAADALQMAQKSAINTSSSTAASATATVPFEIRKVKEQINGNCPIRSRRNDVLEIAYTARYGASPEAARTGVVYDSSLQRGTGQPYQMVLGSGDMINGVDQGLYDMCPGDVRILQIPPALGYGPRARNLYRIPDQSVLYWEVELVSVNSVREGSDVGGRDELEGRVPYSRR